VKLIWSAPAKADLAAIHDHYRDSAPEHAFTVIALSVRAARLLAERPKLGPVVQDSDYRKWRIAKTKHILIYRIDSDTLRISRVVHSAQDWLALR
jgi:plasmid stabilization system protein ParE